MEEPTEHRPNSGGAEGKSGAGGGAPEVTRRDECLGRAKQESGGRVLSYQRQEMVSQGVKVHNPKQMCRKADEEIVL